MSIKEPRIIDNDALVVLCLRDYADKMTHFHFKVRAQALGFTLTTQDCHNMLHRATGRVIFLDKTWRLTAAGAEYRRHVIVTLNNIINLTTPQTVCM